MAIDVTDDVLAQWEDKRRAAKSQNVPFFFSLKDNQRALVHFLLDYRQSPHLMMPYHKYYDKPAKEWIGNNLCAKPFGLECALCQKAEETENKKLRAVNFVFLPVYVHSIREKRNGEWVPVTYKGEDGTEHSVNGVRMLDMRYESSDILDALALTFYESSDDALERTITGRDFIIARTGSGLDTKYGLMPSTRATLSLPEIPAYTVEKAKEEVKQHRPLMLPDDIAVKESSDSSPGLAKDIDPFLPDDWEA